MAERLRLRARAAGESLSDRMRRYAEEGTRREEHPLVTFRDGPTGRRAGLLGGPDVWESSRFSRRPAGIPNLTEAVQHTAARPLEDRVVYLRQPSADP